MNRPLTRPSGPLSPSEGERGRFMVASPHRKCELYDQRFSHPNREPVTTNFFAYATKDCTETATRIDGIPAPRFGWIVCGPNKRLSLL